MRRARRAEAMLTSRSRQAGFTLLEAIVVIVITGIVAAMIALFIRQPVEAYVATAQRAALVDAADTAARHLQRAVQAALPNSIRVDATHLELIPVRGAGRYRAEPGAAAAPGDPLSFTTLDGSFDVLGPPVTVSAGDSLVIYNLGIPGADAYTMPTLANRRVATAGGASIAFTPTATPLPFASPGSRFHIVGTPVSYVCTGGNLVRYAGYGFPSPSTLTPTLNFGAAVPEILAANVSACVFTYTPGALQRMGLVTLSLTLTHPASGESVTLRQDLNVDNTP